MEAEETDSRGPSARAKKAPEKDVELIIEDGDLASWMPINNAFALEIDDGMPHPLEYWNGVVIPIGKYKEHKKEESLLDVFGSARFERADGSAVRALMGDLEWINVVWDIGEAESLDHQYAHGNWKDLEDKLTERLKPRVIEMTKPSLVPSTLITYWWKGPAGGFDLSATETFGSKGRRNSRYVFHLKGPALVRVKRNGAAAPEALKEVSRIVVSSIRKGSGPNGGGIDPPPRKP